MNRKAITHAALMLFAGASVLALASMASAGQKGGGQVPHEPHVSPVCYGPQADCLPIPPSWYEPGGWGGEFPNHIYHAGPQPPPDDGNHVLECDGHGICLVKCINGANDCSELNSWWIPVGDSGGGGDSGWGETPASKQGGLGRGVNGCVKSPGRADC